jgi:hypothetical protein
MFQLPVKLPVPVVRMMVIMMVPTAEAKMEPDHRPGSDVNRRWGDVDDRGRLLIYNHRRRSLLDVNRRGLHHWG